MAFPSGVTFGVLLHSGSYIKRVVNAKKVDVKELLSSAGEIAVMHAHRTRFEFQVEGGGATTVDTGIGASGLSSISGGGTIIEDVTVEEGNTEFIGFKYSGKNGPTAVTG
jgi:hypothetical protein